jgi:hypothetical protein
MDSASDLDRETMTIANQSFIAGSNLEAMRGISMLRTYDLVPGQIIYRFIDVTRSPGPIPAANGPWWMEFEAFQQIKHFGLRHGYSLDYSARLHQAILYEWSEVTGYVRAEVLQGLRCWKGRGKQVARAGSDPRDSSTMTPMQSVNEVYQLYIPGITRQTKLFSSVLKFFEYVPC